MTNRIFAVAVLILLTTIAPVTPKAMPRLRHSLTPKLSRLTNATPLG